MTKVFVETSTHLIEGIDEMVKEGYYSNRTEAVTEAINQLLKQYKISKLHAKDAAENGPRRLGGRPFDNEARERP